MHFLSNFQQSNFNLLQIRYSYSYCHCLVNNFFPQIPCIPAFKVVTYIFNIVFKALASFFLSIPEFPQWFGSFFAFCGGDFDTDSHFLTE